MSMIHFCLKIYVWANFSNILCLHTAHALSAPEDECIARTYTEFTYERQQRWRWQKKKQNNNNTYRMSPWRFFSHILLSRWIGLTAKTYEKKNWELSRLLIRTCTVPINDRKCNFYFCWSLNTMKHPHQNIITLFDLVHKTKIGCCRCDHLNGWIS